MDKTVRETIASAGFPKFCYKSLTKPPEYLILIDMPTHRDHYAFLADQIAAALKSEDIFVKRYFYENSPQICFEELTQERVYLSDLQTKFGDSRLIIFGNGEELLDPVSGQSETWTEIFHTWQDKAILTPERPQRWGMREITLAEQFIVLPDTSEGLTELARHFDAESKPDLKKWHEEDDKPDISEDKFDDVTALKHYLKEDAFQWLCACAVYPELHWNLTLYLGMTDKNWLTENNLLKLIRLPWFRKGVMPDTLRWELIISLNKEKNKEIRQEIIRILENSPPHKDSHAYNHYSLNLAMQKWMLGKKSRKEKQEILKNLRQADEKDIIQDYTFLRFLESVPTPLTLVLPKYLRKVLYKNGVPMFGFNTGVRMLITALCVMLAVMVITPPKPKYQLRSTPITVSEKEFIKIFSLDEKTWRPLEYIQNDFKDNKDGTITDYATGLMWQKSGSPDWVYLKDLPAYIEKLNRDKFAGYSDWRLPTVDELKSLITENKQSNNLYINPIFDKKQRWCWTSDNRASGGAWYVDFFYGNVYWYYDDNLYARAVRLRQ